MQANSSCCDFSESMSNSVLSTDKLLFVTVACACYTDSVPKWKHVDQLSKVNIKDQFKFTAVAEGEVFKKLVKKHETRIESLPILVELPKCKARDKATDYIFISEDNAELLFSDSVKRMIIDRMTNKI